MSKHLFNPSVKSLTERHDYLLGEKIDKLSLNNDGVEGLLTSLDGKISKGQDVKVAGSDLQQVLMYGRHYDGTLHPLETTANDRLLVDVVELTNVGQLTTSSSLPAMQICGFHTGDSRFKSLKCDTDAKLEISQLSNRSAEVSIVSSSVIGANLQIGSNIDISTNRSILIYGSATGNHNWNLLHSSDNSNFFLHSVITPTAYDSVYHYNVKIEDGLRYYKLVNNNSSNTFTLNYISL